MVYRSNIGIYKITNIINNKCYIGSSLDVNYRIQNHKCNLKQGKHHSIYLQHAWDKYKEENFTFVIILRCKKEEILIKEQEMIEKYNCVIPFGYNIRKIAESNFGLIPSQETKDKIANSLTGKTQTEESNIKRSNTLKGRKFTKEHNEKIAKANTGRIQSEKTRKKIGIKNKGKDHWTGRMHSEESKNKMSIAKKNTSEQTKKQISDTLKKYYKDHPSPLIGKKHTEETLQKMRDKASNRKRKINPK